MLSFHNAFCILSLLLTSVCTAIDDRPVQQISNDEGAKQELWMRVAIQALRDLNSPCPFEAFGTAVVNHTSTHDDLICIGANAISTGNPTLHGEIAAINNCTAVLSDPNGNIATLGNFGWSQIDFTSHELFRHASGLKTTTKLIGGVLSDETDGFFAWQFDELAQCPLGCERDAGLRMCTQSAFNADEYAKTEL
ncbi:hypothetical protein LTR94_019792 [Friedmanniomyces endolithicus]|nr:hypothetical protein LTR94_019792 [Friedmanniomyces endolithicus]